MSFCPRCNTKVKGRLTNEYFDGTLICDKCAENLIPCPICSKYFEESQMFGDRCISCSQNQNIED